MPGGAAIRLVQLLLPAIELAATGDIKADRAREVFARLCAPRMVKDSP